MSDKYWTERKGDTIVVHTEYVKSVARFTDGYASIQRGGEFISAEESANAYCAALEIKGYVKRSVTQ